MDGMDPRPIKHAGALMAMIRREIEPSLIAGGFQCAGTSSPRGRMASRWFDYSRGEAVFSLHWDCVEARLNASLIDGDGQVHEVATADLKQVRSNPADLLRQINPFIESVKVAASQT